MRVVSTLSATAAVAAAAATEPLTPGCARWGCDPGNSFAASLAPPGAGPLSPGVLWSVPWPSSSLSANVTTASAGCVSTGERAACLAPPGSGGGLLALDGGGAALWSYAGPGAYAGCDATLPFAASNLPITNAGGDVVAWDGASVVYLAGADGSPAWARTVDPPGPCGAALGAVSLTNHSDLTFTIAPTGEVFAYLPSGVPQSYILLQGADTGTAVFPPPPPPGAAAAADAATPSPSPSPTGVFVPISQQAIDGERIVVVARFYAFSAAASASTRSTRGAPAVPPPLTTLVPSRHLYLLGVDQRNAAVDRLYWAWQLALPIGGSPVGDGPACVPAALPGGVPPAVDPVAVTGPVGLPRAPGTLALGLSCGGATLGFAAVVNDWGSGGGGGGAVVPSVAWAANWTAALGGGGGAAGAFWAVDPQPANASATPSDTLLLVPVNGSALAAVDAATGAPTDALLPLGPALAPLVHEQCGLGLALQQPGAAFLPTGPLLASPGGGVDPATGANTTLLLVPGRAVVGVGAPYHPPFWLAAYQLAGAAGSRTLTGLWCVPTPANITARGAAAAGFGTRPLTGQVALLAPASGNDGAVIAVAMPDGVYGLGVGGGARFKAR